VTRSAKALVVPGTPRTAASTWRARTFQFAEIAAQQLDAPGRADAGGQHVGAGLLIGMVQAFASRRELQCPVELGDQAVDVHARPPLVLGLEVDHRLEHLERRGSVAVPARPPLP